MPGPIGRIYRAAEGVACHSRAGATRVRSPNGPQTKRGLFMPQGIRIGLASLALLVTLLGTMQAVACQPRDFLSLDLPQNYAPPELAALETAYEDLVISSDSTAVSLDGRTWFKLGEIRAVSNAEALRDPTTREQFKYRYPLDFDLTRREEPFFDPGRLRHGAFFEALYFTTEAVARASLDTVRVPGLTSGAFQVTRKRNVSCQFEAALAALAASGEDYSEFFKGAGGGFNWRAIAGTTRMSTHSFGIAVDLNTKLGKYWRWTGAREGAVPHYDNEIPESLVTTMERFGFIWGGKWHHFDGMHFEYRPELILYSRMTPA